MGHGLRELISPVTIGSRDSRNLGSTLLTLPDVITRMWREIFFGHYEIEYYKLNIKYQFRQSINIYFKLTFIPLPKSFVRQPNDCSL